MPTPPFTVTCLSNTLIAHDVYEARFTKPEGFTFLPGQFVLFDVPLLDNPADIQTRAYSIASIPSDTELLFVFKLVPNGRASKWVAAALKEGTQVVMKGPFGNFTIKGTDRDFLFLATSTGMAPFRSHILSLLEQGNTRRIDVVFGVWTEQDLFWMDEMRTLEQTHPQFHLHVTLTAPSPEWTGQTGYVQKVAAALIPDLTRVSLYACGNPNMTKEVKQLAAAEWRMTKEQVHVEGYI